MSTASPHPDDARQSQRDAAEQRLHFETQQLVAEEVYQAPMARAVRLMKAVSVTSCTLTSIGMPVLCLVSDQDASTIGKVSQS